MVATKYSKTFLGIVCKIFANYGNIKLESSFLHFWKKRLVECGVEYKDVTFYSQMSKLVKEGFLKRDGKYFLLTECGEETQEEMIIYFEKKISIYYITSYNNHHNNYIKDNSITNGKRNWRVLDKEKRKIIDDKAACKPMQGKREVKRLGKYLWTTTRTSGQEIPFIKALPSYWLSHDSELSEDVFDKMSPEEASEILSLIDNSYVLQGLRPIYPNSNTPENINKFFTLTNAFFKAYKTHTDLIKRLKHYLYWENKNYAQKRLKTHDSIFGVPIPPILLNSKSYKYKEVGYKVGHNTRIVNLVIWESVGKDGITIKRRAMDIDNTVVVEDVQITNPHAILELRTSDVFIANIMNNDPSLKCLKNIYGNAYPPIMVTYIQWDESKKTVNKMTLKKKYLLSTGASADLGEKNDLYKYLIKKINKPNLKEKPRDIKHRTEREQHRVEDEVIAYLENRPTEEYNTTNKANKAFDIRLNKLVQDLKNGTVVWEEPESQQEYRDRHIQEKKILDENERNIL